MLTRVEIYVPLMQNMKQQQLSIIILIIHANAMTQHAVSQQVIQEVRLAISLIHAPTVNPLHLSPMFLIFKQFAKQEATSHA